MNQCHSAGVDGETPAGDLVQLSAAATESLVSGSRAGGRDVCSPHRLGKVDKVPDSLESRTWLFHSFPPDPDQLKVRATRLFAVKMGLGGVLSRDA